MPARRLVAVVAALALCISIAAACGDKSQPFEGDNGVPPPLDADTTAPSETTAAPGTGSTNLTAPPRTLREGSTATSAPRTTSPPDDDDPIAAASRGNVGAFARTLLRPRPAANLVLDVLVEGDVGPSANTLDHAVATLKRLTGKPVSVTRTAITGGQQKWTGAELSAAADKSAPTAQGGGTAVIRVLFVRGGLEGNDAAVGVAVRGDVLAVFSDRVDESSSPLVSRSRMEDAVLIHEIGHLLGLVDLAMDTGRDDPDHPHHSRNAQSVMYWAVESTLVGQALNGPPPNSFDEDDLADLARLRSGA